MTPRAPNWAQRAADAVALRDVLTLPRRQLLLLALPLVLVGVWGPWAEYGRWQQARTQVAQQAAQAAAKAAQAVAERLHARYDLLQLAATTLGGDAGQVPPALAVQRLQRFLAGHPGIAGFGIVSAQGRLLRWFDRRGVHAADDTAANQIFTPVEQRPGLLIGPEIHTRHSRRTLLLLRLRPGGGVADGYTLSAAVPTTALLGGTPAGPWTLRLRDARGAASPDAPDAAAAAVPGFPLQVDALWPPTLPLDAYWQPARARWAFELATMLLLAAAGWRIAALLAAQRRYAAMQNTLLDNALVGIALATDRHVLRANRRFAQMLGYDDAAELDGVSFHEVYVDDDDYRRVGALYPQLRAYGSVFVQGVRIRRRDGEVLIADLAGKIVGDAHTRDPSTSVWAFLDVTERHAMQQRFEHLATHDSMTGLPNRLALEQQLPLALARAARSGDALAVGVVDLDDFKPVNDQWGHDVGDALLQEVAQRFGRARRRSDMVARLGGDEFAIVFEGLDPRCAREQLAAAAQRLHGVVEQRFELGAGRSAEVGMTMGLALYPADGDDGDTLLRLADAAMYRAKAHKTARAQWWQFSAPEADTGAPETAFDAYGDDARALLRGVHDGLEAVSGGFVDDFYARLGVERVSGAILSALSPRDMRALRATQAAHLRFLLDPATSADAIVARAERLGRAHALVGVDAATMVESMSLYRELCSAHFRRVALATRSRYHLMLTIERRLLDDIQAELRSLERTLGAYQAAIVAPQPAPGALWPDVAAAELGALAALPGVLACATLRPDVDGVFQIESLAGIEAIGALLRRPELAPRLDPTHPAGRGLIAAAWRSACIERSSSYLDDVRTQAWHEVLRMQRVRSLVAIPVAADAHRSDMILVLLGAFPRQFDAAPMQHFAQGLQRRWRELRANRQHGLPHAVLQQDLALAYRERLFNGGLEMHVQPIVDLRSGALRKVEALARLRLDDGALVSPGVFLPLLGNAELERLFRLGLEQSLAMLRDWDAQGLALELSLNLPPSTLLAPDCANWIGTALRAHGVAPHRLTLELLESESVDDASFADAVARLQPLGVRFAMDDLGAGYSSLTRLATLPFDTLKIDQTLAAQMHARPLDTLRLIATLIQVGHDTRRCVVIEGLEDDALIEAARVLGAHEGQGYAYARPMPAAALPEWVHGRNARVHARGAPRTPLGRLAQRLRARRRGPADDADLRQLVDAVVAAGAAPAG